MNSLFKESIEVVIQFWPLVITLGIAEAIVTNGIYHLFPTAFLVLPIAAMAVVTAIVLNGRIAASFVPGMSFEPVTILKKNGINHLVAVLIVGLPEIAYRLVSRQLEAPYEQRMAISSTINVVVSMVTIYVIPIAYLKRVHLLAVLSGVTFWSKNLHKSRWIMVSVGIALCLHISVGTFFQKQLTLWNSLLAISVGIVVTFLVAVSFAASTKILLGRSEK